jgi:DNA-binding NarL/FixJ family response regulator
VDTPLATGTRVLIVDDNEFNRAGIALYLQNYGCRTLEAGDAATALEMARQHRPDAAVIDIVIPAAPGEKLLSNQSVGLNLVAQLKALDPALAVVVFSAYDDRSEEVRALTNGGLDGIAYLLKGVRPEYLLRALQETAAGLNPVVGDVASRRSRLVEEMLDQLTPAERPWVERALVLMKSLTDRELEVAAYMTASYNTLGIAQSLELSRKTVEVHIGRIYQKLGLDEIDEMASGLRKSGLIAKSFSIYRLLNPT